MQQRQEVGFIQEPPFSSNAETHLQVHPDAAHPSRCVPSPRTGAGPVPPLTTPQPHSMPLGAAMGGGCSRPWSPQTGLLGGHPQLVSWSVRPGAHLQGAPFTCNVSCSTATPGFLGLGLPTPCSVSPSCSWLALSWDFDFNSEVARAQGQFFLPLCFPRPEPRCCLPSRSHS